jgi:proteasome accessory factor B
VSSEKTERLINLTLGLLSSKRYLTKNEIFKNIAGYSGSPETMERMFERDKDELRSMGIEISVGQLDPLFEDEIGYLIKSADIQIQPNEFSKDELLLMTMAANVWKESAFADISKTALMKVSSIDGEIGLNSVAISMIDQQDLDQVQFQIILEAIRTKKYLSFIYKEKKRSIAPLALKSADGFWYLVGMEKEGFIKIFKVVRIESRIEIDSSSNTFERPDDFNLELFFNDRGNRENQKAILRIRENRVNSLRNRGEVQVGSDGWDLLTLDFDDLDQMVKEILWFADDVVVVSPQVLFQEVLGRLKAVTNG